MIKSTAERLRLRNLPGDKEAADLLENTLLTLLQGRDLPFSTIQETYTDLLSDQLIAVDNAPLKTLDESVHEQEIHTALESIADHFFSAVRQTVMGSGWTRHWKLKFEQKNSIKIIKNNIILTRNTELLHHKNGGDRATLEYVFPSNERFIIDVIRYSNKKILIKIAPKLVHDFYLLLPKSFENLKSFLDKYYKVTQGPNKKVSVFENIVIDFSNLNLVITKSSSNHIHGLDFDPISNAFLYHINFSSQDQTPLQENHMTAAQFVALVEEILLLFGEPGFLQD